MYLLRLPLITVEAERVPRLPVNVIDIATGKGLEEVARRAFEEWGCERLFADVDPRNEASLAVLERVGFRRTGTAERTWLVGGAWCDSVYLELRRDQGR